MLSRVVFIDSDYERRTGTPSLLTLYRTGGGSQGGQETDYLAVDGRTTIVPRGGGGVAVELFGGTVGDSEHDRAIISTYVIADGERSNTVVDFDDASKALLEYWSRETGIAPDTVVMSHHGSKYNYSEDVLDANPSIRNAVISVNDKNRYFHPAPEVLLDLVRRLGPDHVFVTRSEPGENVVAGPGGVVGEETNRSRLAEFVGLQVDRHSARVESLRELGDAVLDDSGGGAWRDDKSDLRLVERLLDEGRLSPQKAARYRNSVVALSTLGVVEQLVRGTDMAPSALPSAYRYAPRGRGPRGSNGTEQFFVKQAELQEVAQRTETGSGGALSQEHAGGIGKAGRMFRAAISSALPLFGGVILGNGSPTEPPSKLEFVVESIEAGDHEVSIEVLLADGRRASYADLTVGELWSAYNFVQPGRELRERYPAAISNSGGLVGLEDLTADGWTFAIHPAIADTVLAVPAMRVDMFLEAASRSEGEEFVFVSQLVTGGKRTYTYQWFDTPAVFEVEGQRLVVRAHVDPKECLMRVRLIDLPAWFESTDARGSVAREVGRRMKVAGWTKPGRTVSDALGKARKAGTREHGIEGILQRLRREKEMEALVKQVVDELEPTSDMERMTPFIREVCRDFGPLRKIDRLAKVIALLNWYGDGGQRALPPLPSNVGPMERATANGYFWDDVLEPKGE